MRVTLDAGHGGDDNGCVYEPITESIYTLDMVVKIASMLKHIPDIECNYTRIAYNDTVSLSERGKRADENNADLVISLHVNADNTGDLRGLLLFANNDSIMNGVANRIARSAPEALQRSGSMLYNVKLNDWTHRAYNVVNAFSAPTILVETGFASNEMDRIELMAPSVQLGICSAVVSGIAHYMYVRGD